MTTRRRFAFRIALAIAVAVTLLFAFACWFRAGIATHRWSRLSWDTAASGIGLSRAIVGDGQLIVTIDFGPPRRPMSGQPEPRGWHAGGRWDPGVGVDVKMTYRTASRLGLDGFVANSGRTVGFGVFLGYPAAIAWLVACLLAPPRPTPGRCAACGYDLRATPDRCPECGALVAVGGERL